MDNTQTTKLFQKSIAKILESIDDNIYIMMQSGHFDLFDKMKNSIKTELWSCHDMINLIAENNQLKNKKLGE